MKAFFKILVGVAIIAGVCYCINTFREAEQSEPEPEIIRPDRAVRLHSESDEFVRKYFGTVQGGKRADLSFRVSGTLNRIYVENGANVIKGTLLATLDPRDFKTRISQAQSSLSQAQAQYKNAQADFKRYENLYKQKVIAKAQYDTYQTQVDVAKAAVNAANANLKAVRDALRDTELRAPFDGIIAERTVENFQDVTAKQTIFSLQDLSELEIVFNIPDNDVLTAPIPQVRSLRDLQNHADLFAINARFEAKPEQTFPLRIKEIATQATAANTYPVTAIMPHIEDVRALPGMGVTVEMNFIGEKSQVKNQTKFSLPSTAILNEGEKNFVWKFENESVKKIPVNVGTIHNNSSLEIESDNLHGGDVIVTAGVNFLHEGQHVRILEE